MLLPLLQLSQNIALWRFLQSTLDLITSCNCDDNNNNCNSNLESTKYLNIHSFYFVKNEIFQIGIRFRFYLVLS